LRSARERRGISLRQIAISTKISMVVLEALERDDFSHLPGGIFSRAFVRAYAIEVGLDPEETVQQFLTKFDEAQAARRDTEVPVEVSAEDQAFLNRQRKAASILRVAVVVLLVVIIGALSVWLTSRTKAARRWTQGRPARRSGERFRVADAGHAGGRAGGVRHAAGRTGDCRRARGQRGVLD